MKFVFLAFITCFFYTGIIPLKNFRYSDPEVTYNVGSSITINIPLFDQGRTTEEYEIDKKLPDGLTIDAIAGEITGVPTTPLAKTRFTITAANPVSIVSTTIDITIEEVQKVCLTDLFSISIINTKKNEVEKLIFEAGASQIATGNNKFGVVTQNNFVIVNAINNELETKIAFEEPQSCAFANNVFVVGIEGAVVIIDATSNEEITTLNFPNETPEFITFGNERFAVLFNSGNQDIIRIIDAFTFEVIEEILFQTDVRKIAFGNGRFATANANATCTLIDASTNTRIVDVETGIDSQDVVFGNNVFAISNRSSNTITIVESRSNSNQPLANISVQGFSPSKIAFGNNRFVVLNQGSNNATIVDAVQNIVITTVNTGVNPSFITYGRESFFISSRNNEQMTVINAIDNTTKQVDNINNTFDGDIKFSNLNPAPVFCITSVNNDNQIIANVIDANLNSLVATINLNSTIDSSIPKIIPGNNRFLIINPVLQEGIIVDAAAHRILNVVKPNGALDAGFGNNTFLINGFRTELSVLDASTNLITETINVGDVNLVGNEVVFGQGKFCVIGPGVTEEVFATIIDAETNEVLGQVSVGEGVAEPKVTFGEGQFAVINSTEQKVFFISATSNELEESFDIDQLATDISFGNGHFLITHSKEFNRIFTLIDSDKNIRTIESIGTKSILSTFGNNQFAVVQEESNTLEIVNPIEDSTIDIPVGTTPSKVVFGNNRYLVISPSPTNTVTIIDATTNQILTTINIANPLDAAFSPGGQSQARRTK